MNCSRTSEGHLYSIAFEEHTKKPTYGSAPWKDLARCSTQAARDLLALEFARRLCALPLGVVTLGGCRSVSIALGVCEDDVPRDCLGNGGSREAAKLSELAFAVGEEMLIERVPAQIVSQAIELAYQGSLDAACSAADAADDQARTDAAAIPDVLPQSKAQISSAPIPKLLEQILARAQFLGASDIHLDLLDTGARVRFRVASQLRCDQDLSSLPSVA